MKKSWFGTVAMAIVIGLILSGIMFVPRASAATKAVSNDSLDAAETTVIELDLTLDKTTEVTDTTIPPEAETTVCPPTIKDHEVVVPATEPATTEEPEPEATESVDTNPTKDDSAEPEGCNHLWKSEYMPQTETEEGYLRHDCLKCGESYIEETYPPLGENN